MSCVSISVVQKGCDRLTKSPIFKLVILGVLLLDVVILCIELLLGDMTLLMSQMLNGILIILVIEMVVRLGTKLPRLWHFFYKFWDSFDLLILLGLLYLPDDFHYLALLRLPRFWRMSRVLRGTSMVKSAVTGVAKKVKQKPPRK